MTKTIECNNKMEVTKFFGFHVKENAIQEKNFLDMSDDPETGGFDLFIDGEKVANINWFDHFWGKKPTENEVWEYLRKECRKYIKAPIIYVDKSYVEDIYEPLASVF